MHYFIIVVDHLPFGGVGESGMGQYHGLESILAFSHRKAVLWRSIGMEFLNKIRYPPSSKAKDIQLDLVIGCKVKPHHLPVNKLDPKVE